MRPRKIPFFVLSFKAVEAPFCVEKYRLLKLPSLHVEWLAFNGYNKCTRLAGETALRLAFKVEVSYKIEHW